MRGVTRGLTLVSLLLAMAAGWLRSAEAQVTTTTVQDTVYRADGTPAGGTVVVSWGAFTTASGAAVSAGTTSATIGTGGVLTMALAPNAESTPMGSYYTAIFHLNDGTTSREYWVVPVAVPGGGPAKLAAIRNEVLPTSVAMQTVSKAYVDDSIAAAATGFPLDSSPYVLKAGDTMTGPLVLPADPVSANQAADKNYVDENVAGIAAGLAQKVSLLPSATQVVSQPVGTQLEVNDLNGDLYASQYVNGGGNNGIANALSSANCTSGCEVKAEPTYAAVEQVDAGSVPSMGDVVDARGGSEVHTAANPLAVGTSSSAAASITVVETMTTPQLETLRPGSEGISTSALLLTTSGLTGGTNQFPEQIESPPYNKATYGVLAMRGLYNTQGQHVQAGNQVNCYAVGDCLAGSQFITSSGGYRDSADEGAHPFDLSVTEDTHVFTGVCSTGCTTGSTSLTATVSANPGTQGDGRFLIDTNPAKVISTGLLVSGGRTIFATASFTGTSFAASVFLTTAQAATSQPTLLAPGTVTLAIATSGVTSGFATNTAALPAPSGIACMADPIVSGQEIPNYEMANYIVVDANHIQLTLNKVHGSGATIAVGGLCGYGLEQTVDTTGGIRQLFPVIGSINATTLYYADGLTPVVGISGGFSSSGFLNVSLTVASIARTSNVTTVTTVGNLPADVNGLTLNVSGVADSSYNGSFAVATTGPNSLTYANTGANSTSTGGTLSVLTGGFALYPMAEVLNVYDPTTQSVDGKFGLAPNTVAWAASDPLEEPHYYQQATFADTEFITQYVPRPVSYASAGKQYAGNVGAGVRGWQITNAVPATSYLGAGGTHMVPDDAYVVSGAWNNDLEATAGLNSVLKVHCNLHACNRWDSSYALFDLDSQGGEDFLNFNPQSDSVAWDLAGTFYSFSPTAFSAGTINVGTLNATSITGGISGSAITTGTISAARLPVFGPSGVTHAPGIVPDPGATAGTTRYLREDATWDALGTAATANTGTSGATVPLLNGNNTWSGSNTFPSVTVSQANCLAAATITVPCKAYQGNFTGLGVTGTTGTIVLYTNNAPASATFEICANVVTDTAGSAGFAGLFGAWTSPGGASLASGLLFQSIATVGVALGANCFSLAVQSGASLSFSVAATGASGSPVWETEPVVTRLN